MTDPLPPMAIVFMIVCHAYGDPEKYLGKDHWNSSAGIHWRSWLLENDLIDAANKSTDRGKAWVDFIRATPLPEKCWKLPERAMS
jgi:hypothetical protein